MIDLQMFHGDMIDVLYEVPNESVDLIITSPPYNVGVAYGEEVNDERPVGEYMTFASKAMGQMSRVLKRGGRACIEIGGSGRDFPLSWIWQDVAYRHGLGIYSEIGIQHRKTNQCAWGSWMKADAVATIPNFHMMYVFYKGDDSRKTSQGETRITKEEFVEWTRGYWRINWSVGNSQHPASFPVELPIRCMKLFGHSGDVVLDPFAGGGTTGRACILMDDVSFIGVEIVPKYFNAMAKTLAFENSQLRLFDNGHRSWVESSEHQAQHPKTDFKQLSLALE